MIKVNLLPGKKKKKKKAKPIPAFVIYTIIVTVIAGIVLFFIVNFFNSRIEIKEAKVRENERRIEELKEKIKAVEDFERRNAIFLERKNIIEKLGKNKTIPVKVVDEISAVLPLGVWIKSLALKGLNININCTAFTNTDVVNYVNRLKASKLFSEIFLQQSVQAKSGTYTLYNFSISMKVKI
jgi:Tfp pilus assembly protein PilN